MSVNPARPKGPPLNALRAFEAAARLGGFLAAADELSVTPGAVSQQIKALEAWAGAELFERRAKGVALTALGDSISSDFGAAFDAMGAAVRRLRAGAVQRAIAIAALPSVAQLWLAPRMPKLRRAFPDLEISISALEKRPNLNREMFDISLFLDAPTGRETETVLASDALFPVCAPVVAARLKTTADLIHESWIRDSAWADDWAAWARNAAPELTVKSGPCHSLYSLALGEAESGAGVLMGHTSLVGDSISHGRLVAPFDTQVPSGLSLCLETTAGKAALPVLAVVKALLSV